MIKNICFIICTSFFVLACTEDIDFDQARDFEINPVIESSLVFFNENANEFLINGNEISAFQDFVIVDIFNDQFIIDNLVKTEFKFETVNSINRDFELQVDFLDNNSQLQHTFTFLQEASTNNNDVFSSYTETFEDDTLEALKRTSVLIFTLRILPGQTINENSLGRIELKSLAAFYFNIRDDS